MTFYSFDSDSFISSWRVYYSTESFPDVWECLDRLMRLGRLRCAEPVYGEIEKGGDELCNWIKARKDLVVYPWDQPIQRAVKDIQRQYTNLVNPNGGSGADPWVIALAKIMNGCVVTFEKKVGPGAKYVKIPNVCEGCGVSYTNVFGVIAREKWVFRLER